MKTKEEMSKAAYKAYKDMAAAEDRVRASAEEFIAAFRPFDLNDVNFEAKIAVKAAMSDAILALQKAQDAAVELERIIIETQQAQ